MIDYMIMEAVAVKVRTEDREAEEADRIKEWRKDTSKLKQYQ